MAAQEPIISSPEQPHPRQLTEQFKYSKRVVLRSILGREDGGAGLVGDRVVVGGWVKSRKEKPEPEVPRPDQEASAATNVVSCCCETLIFKIPLLRFITRRLVVKPDAAPLAKKGPSTVYLRINDGSCVANLQLIVESSMSLLGQVMSTGSSVLVEGVLEQPSVHGKHVLQLKVEKILHAATVDLASYPLAKARLSFEFLRAHPHLRPRTTTVASITRIRSNLSYATHMFFQNNGFIFVQMPIITSTDMTNCSKAFQVTTLLGKSDDTEELNPASNRETLSPEAVKAAIKEKSNRIEELKRSDSNKEALITALFDIQKASELALEMEAQKKTASTKLGELDFSKDFFSRQAYLVVSAALHLESYACALSSVYTFGPIFRAENSQSRQLAEMWMVEVQLAFAELEDVMNCAEDYLKFLCQTILEKCSEDIRYTSKRLGNNCSDRLQAISSSPFIRVTYTEALEILNKVQDKTFETKAEWGVDLSKEHRSYLADEIYKQAVIVYDFPKEVKPFYVRVKDDGKLVSAFDILVPKVGLLVTGSQREERGDTLRARIEELGLSQEQYEWYVDLRRHGTVKHSGFSLGFENMVMFSTGLEDMRDTIAFPRTVGCAKS